MGLDLRLYIVRKQSIYSTRDNGKWLGVVPIATFELVRRDELFDNIKENINKILLDTQIVFDDICFEKDKYDDFLEYCNCKDLSDVILSYNEQFRDTNKYHYNDVIACFLRDIDDQCVAILYWR